MNHLQRHSRKLIDSKQPAPEQRPERRESAPAGKRPRQAPAAAASKSRDLV